MALPRGGGKMEHLQVDEKALAASVRAGIRAERSSPWTPWSCLLWSPWAWQELNCGLMCVCMSGITEHKIYEADSVAWFILLGLGAFHLIFYYLQEKDAFNLFLQNNNRHSTGISLLDRFAIDFFWKCLFRKEDVCYVVKTIMEHIEPALTAPSSTGVVCHTRLPPSKGFPNKISNAGGSEIHSEQSDST